MMYFFMFLLGGLFGFMFAIMIITVGVMEEREGKK